MEASSHDGPTLNVQAVEMRTGVTAETLRTWERRYGWPRPKRLSNGYRVYSEEDVSLILAVKRELESGVAAGTAWQRVLAIHRSRPDTAAAISFERLRAALTPALLHFGSDAAQQLLGQAHSVYPLERVLTDVIGASLVEVGARWHDGAITVAQEHFASNLLRDHLVGLSNFFDASPNGSTIVVGAGPGEMHDIGALMVAVLLRRNRYRVLFLGQNIALDRLHTTLEQLRPRLLVLGAARHETAQRCTLVPLEISKMSPPRPLFAFGGRGFDGHRELVEQIAGIHLPGNVVEAVERIDHILGAP